MKEPSQITIEKVAQCWCDPRVSDREMDVELGMVFAELLDRYVRWVDDLQAGMYINCVYCGHRYGPDDEVPATMADALKQHISQCPEHPMSHLIKACRVASEALKAATWYDKNDNSGLNHAIKTIETALNA